MEEIEQDLKNGHPVNCATCHETIMPGDSYVIRGRYMFCDEECAEIEDNEES